MRGSIGHVACVCVCVCVRVLVTDGIGRLGRDGRKKAALTKASDVSRGLAAQKRAERGQLEVLFGFSASYGSRSSQADPW